MLQQSKHPEKSQAWCYRAVIPALNLEKRQNQEIMDSQGCLKPCLKKKFKNIKEIRNYFGDTVNKVQMQYNILCTTLSFVPYKITLQDPTESKDVELYSPFYFEMA